jgi:hypothetical protein
MAQRSPAPSVTESLVSLVLLVASDGAVYAAWHGGERDSGRPILLLANSSLFKEVFLRLKPPDEQLQSDDAKQQKLNETEPHKPSEFE